MKLYLRLDGRFPLSSSEAPAGSVRGSPLSKAILSRWNSLLFQFPRCVDRLIAGDRSYSRFSDGQRRWGEHTRGVGRPNTVRLSSQIYAMERAVLAAETLFASISRSIPASTGRDKEVVCERELARSGELSPLPRPCLAASWAEWAGLVPSGRGLQQVRSNWSYQLSDRP